MTTRRQVFWGQGGFLAPQHLQQQEVWQRACGLRFHRQRIPYYWGFDALTLRDEALANGMVDVTSFSLVTREGEWIHGGSAGANSGGNAVVAERSLLELGVTAKEPLSLYLVLVRERHLEHLALGRAGRLPARHALASEAVEDPFDPQAPAADVDYLTYQPRIVTDLDENAAALIQNCESYKFAELVLIGPGRFRLSGDYVPPCSTLSASGNLGRWMRTLRDLLVSRGNDFAASKRQRGIRAASTSAQEVMRVVMMQTFARYMTSVQEATRTGAASPYDLYQLLRTLVAEFSTFSEDIGYTGAIRGQDGTALPDYDHDDLRACFKLALQRAESLIKALTVGAEVGISLAFDGRFYKADLPVNLFESDKIRFYLAFESPIGGPDLNQRLSRTGKICSIEEMPKLLQAALFGQKIDLLPVPPEELPQKTPNTTYFLVDTRHPSWQVIRNNRNIAVYCDLPPEETVIKLYPVGADE